MSGKADNKKELLRQGVVETTEPTNPNEIKKLKVISPPAPRQQLRGHPMPSKELSEFLNVHVPRKGYLAFNDDIELYSKKNLSFDCACGKSHPVTTSLAIIDFPLEKKGLYLGPNNENIFVLVKSTGALKVKGLKTIASYEAESASKRQQMVSILESRKARG